MMLLQTTPGSAFMQINFLLLAGIIAGLVLFYRGFGLLQRKRLIQDVPSSTIRSAALGLVEVNGTASGESTLLSPLCQLDCYFYQLTAWRLTGSSAEYQHWKKVAEENLSVPFFLEDGTGRLMVNPKGADLEIPPDYSEEYGDARPRGGYGLGSALEMAASPEISVPDAVGHFLARHGIPRDQRIKVEERSVKAGDKLFVMGTLMENRPTQMEAGSPEGNYLSASAADLQRQVALGSALPSSEQELLTTAPGGATRAKPGTSAGCSPVILAKGSNSPTFFISSFSQQQVLGELKWKAPLYIFGGPALTLFCLWNLFSRFGVI